MIRLVVFAGVLLWALSGFSQDKDLKQVALKSLDGYVIHPAASDEVEFKLVPEPVVRFAVASIDEGDVFIWTRAGRPEVAAQICHFDFGGSGMWQHEFSSLSSEPIVLRKGSQTLWRPDVKGVTWTKLPADFTPADTPAARLTQMKSLARRFTGNEQTPGTSSDAKNLKNFEMRMKPKEMFRYESPENGTTDGAIFYFGQEERADPELLLLIEAEVTDGTPGWRYAVAPLTCWPLQVMLDGKEILSLPNLLNRTIYNEPYHNWRWRP